MPTFFVGRSIELALTNFPSDWISLQQDSTIWVSNDKKNQEQDLAWLFRSICMNIKMQPESKNFENFGNDWERSIENIDQYLNQKDLKVQEYHSFEFWIEYEISS